MSADFRLEEYLAEGVENIVRGLVRTSVFHPREAAFMARYALAARRAAALRQAAQERGEHVPPFLIASVTDACNLRCAGCYNRELRGCGADETLDAQQWRRIFDEARELGVGFILLAGGEPLLRPDVLGAAAEFPEILFPVFTNGTLLYGELANVFDRKRNLLPVLSLEGEAARTDARRGAGVHERLDVAMSELRKRHITFGASVTVTKENLGEVTSDDFLAKLADAGCKGVVYVEFVPTDEALRALAPGDAERYALSERLDELRSDGCELLLISFPGDELRSGGCLAAGRGFFHINAKGGAEPCPFSPNSDANLRTLTLRQALDSPLFRALRSGDLLTGEHRGGCVLFEKRKQVERLLASNN